MTLLQHFVLYDSDGNPIAAYPEPYAGYDDLPVDLGGAILSHFALVDRTSRENAEIGIGAADDEITIKREMLGPDSEWYGGPRP